jgi:hypothetical protein
MSPVYFYLSMSVESLPLKIERKKGRSLSNSASALFFSGYFGLGTVLVGAANQVRQR